MKSEINLYARDRGSDRRGVRLLITYGCHLSTTFMIDMMVGLFSGIFLKMEEWSVSRPYLSMRWKRAPIGLTPLLAFTIQLVTNGSSNLSVQYKPRAHKGKLESQKRTVTKTILEKKSPLRSEQPALLFSVCFVGPRLIVSKRLRTLTVPRGRRSDVYWHVHLVSSCRIMSNSLP